MVCFPRDSGEEFSDLLSKWLKKKSQWFLDTIVNKVGKMVGMVPGLGPVSGWPSTQYVGTCLNRGFVVGGRETRRVFCHGRSTHDDKRSRNTCWCCDLFPLKKLRVGQTPRLCSLPSKSNTNTQLVTGSGCSSSTVVRLYHCSWFPSRGDIPMIIILG